MLFDNFYNFDNLIYHVLIEIIICEKMLYNINSFFFEQLSIITLFIRKINFAKFLDRKIDTSKKDW